MFYHALTGKGGTTPAENLEPVLLWENSNPSVAFTAQTVSLDLTDYAGVIVEFNRRDNDQRISSRVYAKKTDQFSVFGGGFTDDTGIARNILAVNNTGVQFGNVNTGTEVCIPSKIYGVKSYLVEPQIGDLLWHNDNPTTALGNTQIDGDYSKYSKILVKGRFSTTNDFQLESVVLKNSTYASGLLATTVNVESSYRGIIFTDAKINININLLVTSGAPTTNNIYCIVTDIYGIE